MSTMQPTQPRTRARVSAAQSIPTFYRMLLRSQLTRGRLFAMGALGLITIVLAAVGSNVDSNDADEIGVFVLSEYAISLQVPLAVLFLATPMLGNLIDDRLLAYLWLKPVPRWHLAVASYAAAVSTLLPVVVLPVIVGAVLTGETSLIVPATLAALLGVLAYSGLNLFLGARLKSGLWIGLLYLVLWENLAARQGDGLARLSIRSYLQTVLQRGTDVEIQLANRSTLGSFLVPLAITVVTVALTAWSLNSRDID